MADGWVVVYDDTVGVGGVNVVTCCDKPDILPELLMLGEAADLGDDVGLGERLVSGEAGLGSETLDVKLSRLGYSPGSQS